MERKPCPICDELRGSLTSRIATLLSGKGITNALLPVSSSFAVIPSIGPLAHGHCLIVPRTHTKNVLVHAYQQGIVNDLLPCLERIYRAFCNAKKGSLVIWEHGVTCDEYDVTLCSTTHGHLHAMPIETRLTSTIFNQLVGQHYADSLENICQNVSIYQEYAVVCEWKPQMASIRFGVVPKSCLRSQLLRQLIGECVGNYDWDWHKNKAVRVMENMIAEAFVTNAIFDTEKSEAEEAAHNHIPAYNHT